MEPFDDSELLPDGQTVRMPEMPDNLEFQVAMDELVAGSEGALHKYLAKLAGVDPSTVSLRSTRWHFNEDAGSSLDYVGAFDSLDLEEQQQPHTKKEKPPFRLDFVADEKDEAYEYSQFADPTRQVRLLRLGKNEGFESDTKYYDHLQIETFDLDSAPQYICLSYVWGAPERFIRINCQGKALMITQNLFHSLKNIFSRYPEYYLWADGVCINQDDIEERASQVQLMGRIYSSCKGVIAHPGHFRYAVVGDAQNSADDQVEAEEPGAESTVSLSHEKPLSLEDGSGSSSLESEIGLVDEVDVEQSDKENYRNTSRAREAVSLMNFMKRAWDGQKDYEVYLDSEWQERSLPSIKGDDAQTWQYLFEFWNEDWLWRTWVLPECVLPPKVIIMFGDDYIVSLDAVMDFWDIVYKRGLPAVLRHGPLAPLFLKVMHLTPVTTFLALRRKRKKMEDIDIIDPSIPDAAGPASSSDAQLTFEEKRGSTRYVWKETPDLLRLLIMCRNNKATDHRDKVYALLGLADDSISRAIRPNYHESNTVLQTFIDVAQRYIKAGRGTELLESAGRSNSIPGLPSWAPDWTQQSRSRFDTQLYNTSKALQDSVRLSDTELNHVRLKGVAMSKVKMVGPAWRFYSDRPQESTFVPMKTRDGEVIDFPPFPDEDARCFLLTFAIQTLEEPDPQTAHVYAESLEKAVVRTLCADRSWSGHRLPSSADTMKQFKRSYRAFRKFYNRGPDSDPEQPHLKPGYPTRVHISGIFHWLLDFPEEEGEKLMKELWPFAMAMQEAMRGRRFAWLESGHMAVLPWDAQIGDEVVIVKGARVPFLFRDTGKSKGEGEEMTFELIGDCYVHGVMDGETLIDTLRVGENQQQDSRGVDGKPQDMKVLLPGAQSVVDWQEFVVV